MKFGFFGLPRAKNSCERIALTLLNGNNSLMSFLLQNSDFSGIKTKTNDTNKIYLEKEISEYVKCNEWKDYWLTLNDGYLKFGRGNAYFVNTRIEFPYQYNGSLTDLKLVHQQLNEHILFRINDLSKRN